VFIVDRLVKVYYGSSWASEDDKSAIAGEYNESMNLLCRKEYVYLSWFHRYWSQKSATAFVDTMQAIRAVDLALIRLNDLSDDAGKKEPPVAPLETDWKCALESLELTFRDLQKAAHGLLTAAI
jgi:hypothetical protein